MFKSSSCSHNWHRSVHQLHSRTNLTPLKAFHAPRNSSPSPERTTYSRRPGRGRARRKFSSTQAGGPLHPLPVRLEVPLDFAAGATAAGSSTSAPAADGSTHGSSTSIPTPASGSRVPRAGEPSPPDVCVSLGVDPARGPERRLIFKSHYTWTRIVNQEKAVWGDYLDRLAVYDKCDSSDYANEYHVCLFYTILFSSD